jgi:branched-chain amino acid transport system permease protein
VAAVGGILYVWWNGQISPSAIALPNSINILVIAVIGGLYRVEAAWLGALVFVVLNNYAESIGFIGARFNTWIGVVFLVIVVLSPNGLMGLWEQGLRRWTRSPQTESEDTTSGEGLPQAEPTRS